MSFRKALLEQECGASNGLVNLSQNIGQNNSKLQSQQNANVRAMMPSLNQGEKFAQEYLNKPGVMNTGLNNTFDMRSLIGNLPQAMKQKQFVNDNQWSSEFSSKHDSRQFQSLWNNSQQNGYNYECNSLPQLPLSINKPMNDFNYNQHMVPIIQPNFSQQHMSLNNYQGSQQTDITSSQFLQNFDDKVLELGNNWSEEYLKEKQHVADKQQTNEDNMNEFDEAMDDDWDRIMGGIPYEPSANDLMSGMYQFAGFNPFINSTNPVGEGKAFLNSGNISDAILNYEAAVQQKPEDSDAWCALGLCHAENETDINAIQAFNKSLSLNPNNKEALLGLAVSMANEFKENEAVTILRKWLQVHTNQNNAEPYKSTGYSTYFLDQSAFDIAEKEFLDAVRNGSMDASTDIDLQNALGILYNINKNFARATDSLKLAISKRPDDARLWNRLGATLANHEKTTEAISAYRQALHLFPNYVRARFNLGISCMHLHSYEQAVEHFVAALQLQKVPQESPIWSTFRTAVIRLPSINTALMEAVDNKDLDEVTRIFTGKY
uniref:TPR_REGION domain-containing protein n=1 Tax=Rhabditophanes sp. KR3021 TaxID=114890 RepID=A0AC35THT4_9BILA